MSPYEQLRAEAAQKRQAAIKRVRKDYRDTLKQIDALRLRLGSEAQGAPRVRRQRPITELITDLMPRDRTFTFADIHRTLCEAEPGREFNQLSLRTTLRQLAQQGLVTKISKNPAGRVLWSAAGSTVKPCPFGSKPLTEVAEIVLRERGPLTPVELVVAVQETGYRADANPRRLVAALRTSARRHPGRFIVDGGRWTVGAFQCLPSVPGDA